MHVPVLLQEVVKFLDPKPGKKYIDATYGMGGHSRELLKFGAEVLGIDQDPTVIASVSEAILEIAASPQASRNDTSRVVQGSFADIKAIAEQNDFTEADGILFDLGMGSHQLDDPGRGFSFQKDGPLDMRYDQTSKTAADIVNFNDEKDLARIFLEYGEEKRFGRKVAKAILLRRKQGAIERTLELFDLIKQALPGKLRFKAGDTARRIFQALRIEVNDELNNLKKGLEQALELLKKPVIARSGASLLRRSGYEGWTKQSHGDRHGLRPRDDEAVGGGRLVLISFHSLEDRIVKHFFQNSAKNCVCPPDFPECVCQTKPSLRILTKKPVTASESEIKNNPRSASAKLRVAEKI